MDRCFGDSGCRAFVVFSSVPEHESKSLLSRSYLTQKDSKQTNYSNDRKANIFGWCVVYSVQVFTSVCVCLCVCLVLCVFVCARECV